MRSGPASQARVCPVTPNAKLMTLADTLTARVAPGGRIALSGILGPQGGEVRACYPGIQWRHEAHEGEWVRIDGIRPPESGHGNPVS